MKTKLYNCNAKFDTEDYTLISYATPVVSFKTFLRDGYAFKEVSIYRASMTTMQHIRKYIAKLKELERYDLANLVEEAYFFSVHEKKPIYDFAMCPETGEVLYGDDISF